jgi:hypothetical protein
MIRLFSELEEDIHKHLSESQELSPLTLSVSVSTDRYVVIPVS